MDSLSHGRTQKKEEKNIPFVLEAEQSNRDRERGGTDDGTDRRIDSMSNTHRMYMCVVTLCIMYDVRLSCVHRAVSCVVRIVLCCVLC